MTRYFVPKFYLGTHRPSWIAFMKVPLFLSASTMHTYTRERRKTPGVGDGDWAFDSGAFTALSPLTGGNPAHPWHREPDDYGAMVTRVADEVGARPRFAAPQDWPCEPPVRRITGFSVERHQEFTTDNFEYLAEQFYFLPWIPVLQGWTVREYLRHMELYAARGIDLSQYPTVGLGSVCRRGPVKPIVAIVEAVQARAVEMYGEHLPLHGFGMNIKALSEVGHLVASSDSLSWSDTARKEHARLPGCTHVSQYCNNCSEYALLWREKVLRAFDAPKQMSLGIVA